MKTLRLHRQSIAVASAAIIVSCAAWAQDSVPGKPVDSGPSYEPAHIADVHMVELHLTQAPTVSLIKNADMPIPQMRTTIKGTYLVVKGAFSSKTCLNGHISNENLVLVLENSAQSQLSVKGHMLLNASDAHLLYPTGGGFQNCAGFEPKRLELKIPVVIPLGNDDSPSSIMFDGFNGNYVVFIRADGSLEVKKYTLNAPKE